MKIEIAEPKTIPATLLEQVKQLIIAGGQIQENGLTDRLMQSEYIAYILMDDEVAATATLKIPNPQYRNRVFREAKTPENEISFDRELGYIVTAEKFKGRKYCQTLLASLFPRISDRKIYATTRRESMMHILRKFEFVKSGSTYKGDLQLLLHNGKK